MVFGESGLRVRWADVAFDAIRAQEPRWRLDAVHLYMDVDEDEYDTQGDEMDLDVHIELQAPPDGAGYTAAVLSEADAGLLVAAPDPRGPSALEGIPLEEDAALDCPPYAHIPARVCVLLPVAGAVTKAL